MAAAVVVTAKAKATTQKATQKATQKRRSEAKNSFINQWSKKARN